MTREYTKKKPGAYWKGITVIYFKLLNYLTQIKSYIKNTKPDKSTNIWGNKIKYYSISNKLKSTLKDKYNA